MGIPKTTQKVSFSTPTFIIDLVDAHCFSSGETRSSFITKAMRNYLLSQYDSPAFWNEMYQKKKALSHYSVRNMRKNGGRGNTGEITFKRPRISLWDRVFKGVS